MAGQPMVDTEARERVASVETKLVSHEDHCGERWNATTKAMEGLDRRIVSLESKISDSISKVHAKIDRFATYALWTLAGIAGFAIVQWLLWAKVIQSGSGV